ncbi:MAG: sulfatase-like hydrolase/transferase [Gemmataceae bacterium]
MLRLVAALVVAALVAAPVAAQAAKPNVVFLLADDLGFGDLRCTGHPYAQTPTIDRLAREGTLFHGFYVGGATCCPSRTAFLTGRFPATFARYPADFGFGDAPTVTALLAANGYRVGHVGKWHVGPTQAPGTYGIHTVRVSGGNRRDPRGRDAEVADHAVEFLRENKDRPFYLNVWFHTVHNPVNPPASFVERFRGVTVNPLDFPAATRDRFAAHAAAGADVSAEMRKHLGDVFQLDGQVARILAALDELNLRGNTIVVFTGDNGPNDYGSAGPYRAAKHSLHEGGVREPLIARWPGRVPAGRTDTTSVLAGVDWLPTLCALTGTRPPAAGLDGEDVSAALLGAARPRAKDLFWKASAPGDTPAMRRGNWKLHQPVRAKAGPVELYDLARDPGEAENVAARHPQVVADLGAALRRWNDALPKRYEKGTASDD